MQYTTLSNTDLRVSRLCLGTMTFGFQTDEAESNAILDKAFDEGINFIDTANVYPLGEDLSRVGVTESIIGKWIGGRRDKVVLATKCGSAMSSDPLDRGSSRRHILKSVDASLKRLNVEYVDLYQLHHPDHETPIHETLEALDEVVRSGRARYVGCSNFTADSIASALGVSAARELQPFVTIQQRYNLLAREAENNVLPLAEDHALGVMSYNPLAGGLLTGKHIDQMQTEGRYGKGRGAQIYRDRYWHDGQLETVRDIVSLANQAGTSASSLAVAWVLANLTVSSAIVGASKSHQLADSLAAVDAPLNPELKNQLDSLTDRYRPTVPSGPLTESGQKRS
ncbi:aldo/keto reductase [Pseudarthrobacter sulfonivorans]|uniref:aldo/keto reductase n=1 Tax=Pseudarthrobacter sulfonivorans TaxID=121292 RepID=UPI00168B3091|nr:aldo/keto reductase [Pseudarthrobacter sulfonivorans]